MLGTTPAHSLADAEEKELVRHLLNDWHWGSPIVSMFGLPVPSRSLLEVATIELGKPGDVDLLLTPISDPRESVAVQFKIIKVREDTYYTGRPNKLQHLHKLYLQTNELVRLGFSRAFACVLVLIDQRRTPPDTQIIGGLSEELLAEIHNSITLCGLNPRAGFLRVDLVQDPETAPLTTGGVSCHLIRPAMRQAQSERLTTWITSRLLAS